MQHSSYLMLKIHVLIVSAASIKLYMYIYKVDSLRVKRKKIEKILEEKGGAGKTMIRCMCRLP